MRKRYKNKKASCALCKPHKRKWAIRWNHRELDFLKRSDHVIRSPDTTLEAEN